MIEKIEIITNCPWCNKETKQRENLLVTNVCVYLCENCNEWFSLEPTKAYKDYREGVFGTFM